MCRGGRMATIKKTGKKEVKVVEKQKEKNSKRQEVKPRKKEIKKMKEREEIDSPVIVHLAIHKRTLTAEGWKRRMMKRLGGQKVKSKK